MVSIQKNKGIYLFSLMFSVVIGIIAIASLYVFNWTIIVESYHEHEGALGVVLIIGIRMFIISLMTIYTFYSWFKQEEQFFSDMPFLFGLFFLLLVFGKALDLFIDFIYYQLEETIVLFFIKLRFLILIFDVLPMIYLSVGMILFSLSLKSRFQKLADKDKGNKIRNRILLIIIAIEIIAMILAPDIIIVSILYPIVVIPSLITIVWLFQFAYKNKRLSQVNTLILTIGFGFYLISQIIRPLVQFIIGESALFVIVAESIDLLLFIVIFIGFYKETNYAEK